MSMGLAMGLSVGLTVTLSMGPAMGLSMGFIMDLSVRSFILGTDFLYRELTFQLLIEVLLR